MDKVLHLDCDCFELEHTLRYSYLIDNDIRLSEVFVHTFLSLQPWYKRIWHGIKYIFGYKSKYGHFDETTLEYKKVIKLRDFLTDFITEAEQAAG